MRLRSLYAGLVLGSWLLAGCASSAPKADNKTSLYERLGGKKAIAAVVNEFLSRAVKDNRINSFFAGVDMENFHKHLFQFACMATGGPCPYEGRDMKTAHHNLFITNAAFDAVLEDLRFAMAKLKVGDEEQKEVLGAFNSTRKDVVELH